MSITKTPERGESIAINQLSAANDQPRMSLRVNSEAFREPTFSLD
jgi:hypothetical protein